jgi:hypothetical protein
MGLFSSRLDRLGVKADSLGEWLRGCVAAWLRGARDVTARRNSRWMRYAWSLATDETRRKFVAGLGGGPVRDTVTAVRASIVAETREVAASTCRGPSVLGRPPHDPLHTRDASRGTC